MTKATKRRVVLTFQDFNGGMPTTLLVSYEADSKMTIEKAFDYAVARLREEKFTVKAKEHAHD